MSSDLISWGCTLNQSVTFLSFTRLMRVSDKLQFPAQSLQALTVHQYVLQQIGMLEDRRCQPAGS